MARSDDPLREREIWGTWEELLLACAVNRHGTRSWDSVAMEVRSRSPNAHLLTAENCKERYHDLKRRFSAVGDEINGGDDVDEAGDDESTAEIPWLEELRKLRVAELRQEVQRYDVSIGSLQLKVKRLKEERERSLREADAGDGVSGSGSDLKKKDENRKDHSESPGSTPGNVAGDRISGGDSGRSCEESNSTDPKEEGEGKPADEVREEPDAAPGSGSDPVAAGEASYNGSTDTIAKGAAARSPPPEPNPVGESGESVAESKGGEAEGTKESSDVQSSASLSRRRRRGRRRKAAVSVTSSGGYEPEADAVSPVREPVSVESQPLIAFLEIIRSNKYGSVFERRLESQESVRYRSLIRRHVDLDMARSKIRRNGYTSVEFFRDLLLLCNNAIVFYPKSSPELIAAVHLRDLIGKEMDGILRKPHQPSPPAAREPTQPSIPPPQPPPVAPKPKSDPDRAISPLDKPASLPPLVACRKRSSISAKPQPPKKIANDEKPVTEEEQSLDKKSTKQRSAVSRGLRTNKTRGNKGGGAGVKCPNPVPTPKMDPEAKPAVAAVSTAKKRSAANFLNRMKRNSPTSSNGTLLETLKSSAASSGGDGGKGADQKKKSREDGRKESVTVKRSVGRPPKRAAASPLPPHPAKRAREERTPPPSRKRGRR